MNTDGRALSDRELERIQNDVFIGMPNDADIGRLIQTIHVQRKVLRELFSLFTADPLNRVSTSNAVRNSTLNHFKELVSMEDQRS